MDKRSWLDYSSKETLFDSILQKTKTVNGCWVWQGATTKGYGRTQPRPNEKYIRVHKFVYEHIYGKTDLSICHHCDNPSCINPAHLFAGTHQQNMTDKALKKRAINGAHIVNGENCHLSKLTKEQVLKIVELCNNGMRQIDVSNKLDISKSLISAIMCGRSWGRTTGIVYTRKHKLKKGF